MNSVSLLPYLQNACVNRGSWLRRGLKENGYKCSGPPKMFFYHGSVASFSQPHKVMRGGMACWILTRWNPGGRTRRGRLLRFFVVKWTSGLGLSSWREMWGHIHLNGAANACSRAWGFLGKIMLCQPSEEGTTGLLGVLLRDQHRNLKACLILHLYILNSASK